MAPDTAQKADQIAHRFFTKCVLVVVDARNVHPEAPEDGKSDKWFNLETPDTDAYKEHLRVYRSISQLRGSAPPPLEVQVLLAVPELTNNQVLVQRPPNASRVRVKPTPTHILLESWVLSFATTQSNHPPSESSSPGEVTLATVYKHALSVFRSLYTLLRVLPAWRICKRLRRRAGLTSRGNNLNVVLRVQVRGTGEDTSLPENTRVLDFDMPLSPSAPALPTATHAFDPITHPMGIFKLAVTYLTTPHFELDTVESLESSRILSLDAGPEFVPTLARTAQRDSISGSPGSLPIRTSLPRSPPSSLPSAGLAGPATGLGLIGTGQTSSIADRFVLPAANSSRTSFPGTSPRTRNVPLPAAVQRSTSAAPTTGSGSPVGSLGSSSRLSREEGREGISSMALRTRRESTGMGRGTGSELPSTPGGVSIRRPSINAVHPFKSSTLSSGSPSLYSGSPSFRHASPLSTGPSLPGRPPNPPSPTSARQQAFRNPSDVPVPTPPLSAGPGIQAFRAGSSPVLPLRPSPPGAGAGALFSPSSLGERRFPVVSTSVDTGANADSPAVGPLAMPGRRKRYSSSFGYRYAQTGGVGSDVSAGSGEKGKEKEGERVGSASYLSTNTDDDDISAFVQDIDARKPIGGGIDRPLERDRTVSEAGGQPEPRPPFPRSSPSLRGRTISEGPLGPRSSSLARHAAAMAEAEEAANQAGAMMMSQFQIDERLKQLREQFNATMNVMERRSGGSGEKGKGKAESPRLDHHLIALPPSSPSSPANRLPPSPTAERSSPLSRQFRPDPMTRRVATTPGGDYSIWDNKDKDLRPRRVRTDSAGSGATGLSELDRARLIYAQGGTARGSAGSIGSEEVLGKMELDR